MTKPIDEHSDQQLRNVIENHRTHGKVHEPCRAEDRSVSRIEAMVAKRKALNTVIIVRTLSPAFPYR